MDGKDSNHNSITHDTNPRKLRFLLMSQDPADLVGDGNILQDLGTKVDLANLAAIGANTPAVLGPILSDVTGGATDKLTLTLVSPTLPQDVAPNYCPIGDLLTGDSTWTITYTDASTSTLTISATDLTALAAAQGLSGLIGGSIDLTTFFPTIIGKTIDSVVYSTTTDYTFSNGVPLDFDTSGLQLELTSANIGSTLQLQNGNGGSQGPGIGIIIQPIYFYRIIFAFHSAATTVTTTVDIPIDAPTLVGSASPGQQAMQIYFSGGPIQVTGSAAILNPYIGWTITDASGTVPITYGPGTLTDLSEFFFVLLDGYATPFVSRVRHLATVPIADPSGTLAVVINAQTALAFYFNLYPTTTPAVYFPLLITEPFECKNRNLPAFKFRVFPNGAWDENMRTIQAFLLVSQGAQDSGRVFPVPIGQETEDPQVDWTCVDTSYFNNAASGFGSQAFADQGFVLVDCSDVGQGLSPAFQNGALAVLSKDFTGPWNFYRWIILPYAGDNDAPPDYTGGLLEIIANAREL